MTGNEIREALDRAKVLPSKQLGQNFLIDANIARAIVALLELSSDEAVVEVGPGVGSLTEHLLEKARRIILIEFDARLAEELRNRYASNDKVEVHHADGAKFDRRVLFRHRPVKFLGNLPYSSGGAIMKNLLSRPHPFSRGVIMLQKEVIDRLGAQPGTKDYGILSLRMQVNWEVAPKRIVPPEAFYPRPRIDSSVAVLTPRDQSQEAPFDAKLFDELVRRGFSQRRKQLKKQLPASPPWEEVATKLSLSQTVRGEELNLPKWLEVTRSYDPNPLKDHAQNSEELFDIVDEDDIPVGTATREMAHARNLIHRAIHVFVFNKHGDLWLQKRSLQKDTNPGLWDSSVSGHLDAGEDYRSAATRELGEEIGLREIDAESLNFCLSVRPSESTGWEHIHVFETTYKGAPKFPAAEIDSMMPFSLVEIEAWMRASPADFSSAFRVLFRDYLKLKS
ncbi:MAG: 16S rRNA (adenine(1518)-N(6)/adenine(1519)-N(6))-dimethyltransferase RsmA [Akkermansiaceae bacterium]